MEAFLIYILKSSVCTAAFYLFYRLLLSRETFHRFNRVTLLCILLFSAIIPLCEITVFVPQQTVPVALNPLPPDAGEQAETTLQKLQTTMFPVEEALTVYWAGFILFACRGLYSLLQILLLLRKGERKAKEKGIILIVHNEEKTAPFSWMKYIVISRKDLEENRKEILTHERAHIRNRHSIDLLLADVCILFQWFNPAAWLMKQELQNVHEYEADEAVINQGIDAKKYQLLLIKKAVNTKLYAMANSFNHSKLKKRITMMLKEKSSSRACWKYLYMLPVIAVTLSVFARSEVRSDSYEWNKISGFKTDDSVDSIPPVVVTRYAKLKKSVSAGSDSTLIVADATSEGSQTLEQDTSALTVNFNKVGINAITPTTISDITIGEEKTGDNPLKIPLTIIDGQEITSKALLSAINPHSIESISILKDEAATKIYGEKGVNGVIIITLKSEKK
jgi:TonB-dependent SusC/RagA subfamily outer membrane receptor